MAIRTRAGSPTVWLEVTYQGLEAPRDFFADLALIGWTPPTVAPPPHDAIDWSRPNEATGERFTLRPYTVAAAIVQPPTGSGSRGGWTDAERSANIAALARVLDRHAAIEVDDPGAIVRGAVPGAAAPPAPVVAVAASAPAERAAPAFVPGPEATAVLVTAPIKPSLGPAVEDALVALGVTAVFDSQERLKVERYRASTYETTVTELHVAVVVPPPQLPTVVAALEGFGLGLTFAELDEATVGPDAPPEPDPEAEPETAAPPPALRAGGLARVVALADPRAGDAVAAVIRSLGLVDARVTASSRLEVSRYRGSRSEREVPALRVEAWVPEPHALLVANHLAQAARLRMSDTERIWIEPPPPAAGPTPAAAPTDEPAPSVHPAAVAPATSAATATTTSGPVVPDPPAAPAAAPTVADRTGSQAVLDPARLTRRIDPVFVDHGA